MITRTKHLGRAKKLLLIPILCVFVTACTAIQGNRGSDDTLQKKIQAFEERLRVLESGQAPITGLLIQARAATAYIRGQYTFVDAVGRPLRHVLNDVGEPIADPQGVPLVDTTGSGDIAITEYCGTAFLVDWRGDLLTNRHIAEPWWEDESSEPLLAAGLRPVFLRLRAFFQERPQAVTIEVVRVHAEQDIALIRTMGWIPMAEPLPLYTEPQQLEEGQPVIMMGYPTGLDAILARLDYSERAKLEAETGGKGYRMVERLAEARELRPSITGGYLWEVLPNTLVYDARTGPGGSGGPLLDHHGRVIGVNAAYLPTFHGGNYAIPIRYGQLLLGGGGLTVTEASRETTDLALIPHRSQEAQTAKDSIKNQ